jgi:hypothetical protein
VRLTYSDNVTIGVGLICVAFSFWLGSPGGALACFVSGGVILIVSHLKQDGLSSGTSSDLELNETDGGLDRRAPARGPFPPFPLGGSLKKADVFDFIGTYPGDQWHPVRNAIDIEIDWSQFRNTDLFADVTLRGHNVRVGLLDIENNHVAVHTDTLTAPLAARDWGGISDDPRPEELLHHQFRIPPQVGVKRYRLVAERASGGGTATYWLEGTITFRRISLGQNTTEWFTPVEGGPLRWRSPGAVEAVVDWSMVRVPVNTVIADFGATVACTIAGDRGRGRAILRDLVDDTTIATEWVEATGRRMHGAWPIWVARKIALPPKVGIRR